MTTKENIERLSTRLAARDFPYHMYGELIGAITHHKLRPEVVPYIRNVGVAEDGFIFEFKLPEVYIEFEYVYDDKLYGETLKLWESGTFEIFYETNNGRSNVIEYANIDEAIEELHKIILAIDRYQKKEGRGGLTS